MDLKKNIMRLYKDGGCDGLYYSDIADSLHEDIMDVVNACCELESEGVLVEVDYGG